MDVLGDAVAPAFGLVRVLKLHRGRVDAAHPGVAPAFGLVRVLKLLEDDALMGQREVAPAFGLVRVLKPHRPLRRLRAPPSHRPSGWCVC